jgi:arsenate reductase (thioredoxin)
VLFLCTHNAGRSQMALGFLEARASGHAVAWSGGSEPGHEVNPAAIAAMAERGIDISSEFPKPWTDETVRAADVVINMGCGDACPIFPGERYDPGTTSTTPLAWTSQPSAASATISKRRVRQLIDELDLIPLHSSASVAPVTPKPDAARRWQIATLPGAVFPSSHPTSA